MRRYLGGCPSAATWYGGSRIDMKTLSPTQAARIIFILGSKTLDPRTAAYIEGKVQR